MMRLLFLGSSLEPGRDGVGDYIRLLAEACTRQGHPCAVVALNDAHVTAPETSILAAKNGEIPVLRLPAAMEWPQKVELANAFRNRFQPDWISFHLVPYAFHRRGLLFGLVDPFRELTGSVSLHLMFHELWLGAGRPEPLRDYVTGWFQRRAVKRMLSTLQPKWITTSNPAYAAMLRSLPAKATVLPLFGNVPVLTEEAPFSHNVSWMVEKGITETNRHDWWIGIFFGSLHEEWKAEPFMGLLRRAAQRTGKRVCLLLAGRAGAVGETIWKKLQAGFAPEVFFVNRGEQPADEISRLLQIADFGIAASPWQLVGKSGTVAAMLDHGLPVIVTRDDYQPFLGADEPPTDDPLVHRCDGDLEAKLIAGLPRRPAHARVDEIAAELCAQLESQLLVTP
jgi:glycosyltransferase involved in cell wall biosynthesis